MASVAEFESLLSLENPIKSSVAPRWARKQQAVLTDRFIPLRPTGATLAANDSDAAANSHSLGAEDSGDYGRALEGVLGEERDARVLAFRQKPPMPQEGYQNSLKVLYSQSTGRKAEVARSQRHISSTPTRILDAPDMLDDYYLNLLAWSSANVLAVALSQTLYLWSASTGAIAELTNVESEPEDYISSVAWREGGQHIAVGTNSQFVQLWDGEANKQLRNLGGHGARVGALAWNGSLLASGSRDTTVLIHDVRIANHCVGALRSHSQEVCGLSWSPDGSYLASGANDNTLGIFEASAVCSFNATPRHTLTDHQAAVKAIAWSPHERNLLASGGGTADRCIKFWNAQSGVLLNSIDTGSQVCALQWSPFEKELLSSHGYAENQLTLWKYPSMVRVKELKGHTSRVLHLATSPDGSMVCSGAADET